METGNIDLYSELLKTFGVLAVLLAIIIGSLYLFKKLIGLKTAGADISSISLLSSFHLSSREKLVVVEIEGKRLLLGVTQNNISLITRLEDSLEEDLEKKEKTDFPTAFAKSLKEQFFLKKDKKK